jgi:hypothetical protein
MRTKDKGGTRDYRGAGSHTPGSAGRNAKANGAQLTGWVWQASPDSLGSRPSQATCRSARFTD